jgi:SpoVK/Ycf46/Vps4 family AAA+-type ATPase
MNVKKFVELLDQRKQVATMENIHLQNLLYASDHHFAINNYNSPQFSGYTHTHLPITNQKSEYNLFSHDSKQSLFPFYVNGISSSDTVHQNTIFSGIITDTVLNNKSLLDEKSNVPEENKVEITKKRTIDVDIKCFQDILKVIQDNEYHEDTEYNIDLKALIQIKEELILLNNMIGLTSFKNDIVDQLLYFVQNLHGGKDPDFMHTVLCGPPGTGKTEIATLLGKMYSKLGILKNKVFKKVTRSDMVAGYLGQTAIKTKKVIDECIGGCLFIDEAYALANDYSGDSFSRECIDTLCEALSNHKGDIMVIVAGYEKELNQTFFKANPGMESRFIWRFAIEPYNHQELMNIFLNKCKENEWTCCIDNKEMITWFQKNHELFKHFGRDIELLFSYTKIAHGRRVYGKDSSLRKQITHEDICEGMKIFKTHMKKNENGGEMMGMYV